MLEYDKGTRLYEDSSISGQWEDLNDSQKTSLEIVYNKGKIRTMELADKLGVTRQPAKRILESLVEKGFLRLVSTSANDPNQYYEMIKEN